MALKFLALALAATTAVSSVELDSPSIEARDDPCDPCSPPGSSSNPPPAVGPGLSTLYVNLLDSVKGIHYRERSLPLPARANGFCCRRSLKCINVQSLNIPACYDEFRVDYAFADGSYGSLITGDYTSGTGGGTANLLTGNYTNGNDQGNIYASDPQAKPNTATLSIPPEYTGTGIGTAVPASALGSYIVYTTTIPGATYTAPTTVPQTVRVATVSGHPVSVTVPAQTITGATTIAPQTTLVTQAASSHHGAGHVSVDSTRSCFMSIVWSLAYFLYAL